MLFLSCVVHRQLRKSCCFLWMNMAFIVPCERSTLSRFHFHMSQSHSAAWRKFNWTPYTMSGDKTMLINSLFFEAIFFFQFHIHTHTHVWEQLHWWWWDTRIWHLGSFKSQLIHQENQNNTYLLAVHKNKQTCNINYYIKIIGNNFDNQLFVSKL